MAYSVCSGRTNPGENYNGLYNGYGLKVMSKYESKRPLDQGQVPEINRDLSMECGLAKLSVFHEKVLSGDNRAKLTVRKP